ncbi:EAL domain-containing protein [Porphyrobacter algicida]|uniref:EAL domain-containing protein n=1 Tax=Qipengyuania algicida TaxID=1836209 RepID=A0A845AJR6_9SPHN|nr:EAL domain-containing protein [Qipengyuania algicida]MXP29657.1 EAL domain-containing protein [Qipengyuania algicida]
MIAPLTKLVSLRFGSLKLRIAVLYAGLFAVVLTAIVVIAGNTLSHFGEASATRDLAANARVFDELLELRAQQMDRSADVLAHDFGFREAVATRNGPTIDSALDSLKSRSRADAAFVIGIDGNMLASGDTRIRSARALWSALDAGKTHGMIRLDGKLALAAAAPIQAPDLMGWLVIAQPMDRAELGRLKQLAAIDVSAEVVPREQLPKWLRSGNDGQIIERGDAERNLYQISAIPALEGDLSPRLVLRHSLSRSLAGYDRLEAALALLALAAIALVIALSWRVARTVTEPLRKLDEATGAIGEGREVEIKVESSDEIGRLASSFKRMVSAIEERERRIIHVGLHDGLTNLPNRKLFVEQLDRALARLSEGERLMVVYVDLDDFKVINDTLGHPAGDMLLRQVATHLREGLRNADVARLGGDEFAVLIKDIGSAESLAATAEKLLECFTRPIVIDGQQIPCSASLGIAIAPGDGTHGTTLMKHADLALYRAKSEGKATYQFFEPKLDEEARLRRQTELDLRRALHEGGFELHFQPLYSLVEDRLKGFEALVRWNHPERGLVNPVDFIPLAEETGLIIPLGEWILREACWQASQWPEELSVAINISPKQFASGNLAQTILQALSHSGLAPGRLELEITESIFIANVEKTLSTLHGLRDLGVRIALDDFGTGYSSLSYLRSFPFDKVKIDRSFVQDLTTEGNAHAVIRAITTLADALGMETLAEGVEDAGQLEVLRREGCRYIQGFLYSHPLNVSEVGILIDSNGMQRVTRPA